MALLKNGAIAEDSYRIVETAEDLATAGDAIVVPLELWTEQRDAVAEGRTKIGITLPNDVAARDVADQLTGVDLVRLTFPAFADGRAFTQARDLREHHGFAGEIRASGPVFADQYLFLQRCGVDVVELPNDAKVETWLAAANRYSVFYQSAQDRRPFAARQRHAQA